MGARLNNTGRDRNVGFVEHALRLDIRELRKRGDLFIDDELCGIVLEDTGIAVETDLTSPTFPWIKVIFPDGTASGRVQNITIEARPTQSNGRRWFFIDETGAKVEVLYFSDGLFRSRKAARLTYKTQSMGDLDRVVSRREGLRARLEGTTERGPAGGAVRQAKSAQLSAIDDGLDLVGVAMARDIARRRAKQTARRKAWTQALQDAQSAMAQEQDRSPEWVLERFTPSLDRLKAAVPHAPSRTRPPSPDARCRQPAPGAEVDIALLNRMGYVQEGRVLGAQLGWPRDWLAGSKRRLSFLIDLRSRPACAMFIVQDSRKTTTQLFWLQRVKVLFGRREFRFICPTTGVRAGALAYADGQLTPAPDRERVITKSDDPGRIQPTRELEVSTLLSVAQNVFDNPTRFTPDEADLVRKLLRQAASES